MEKDSEWSKCNSYTSSLIATIGKFDNKYFNMLSQGNLIIPSPAITEFVSNDFAKICYDKITTSQSIPTCCRIRTYWRNILKLSALHVKIHVEWGMHYSIKIIINIFYNNKQKISADSIRKDDIIKFDSITYFSTWYFI